MNRVLLTDFQNRAPGEDTTAKPLQSDFAHFVRYRRTIRKAESHIGSACGRKMASVVAKMRLQVHMKKWNMTKIILCTTTLVNAEKT